MKILNQQWGLNWVPVFINLNMEDKLIIEINDDIFYLDYEEYLAWKEFINKKEEEFKDFVYGRFY